MAGISTAITAATTIASANAQANAAHAQNDQNQRQSVLIEQDRANKMLQAQGAEQQVNLEAFQKVDQEGQTARAARATATTAAGEAGVSGNSVDALQREFYTRQADFNESVEANRVADTDRLHLQMQGFNTAAQSSNNSLRQPVQPSYLDAALRIGGGALNAYDKFLYVPPRRGAKDDQSGI